MQRTRYAMKEIAQIPASGYLSQNLIISKNSWLILTIAAGQQPRSTPAACQGIFGGKDLSLEFPELGQSALYCVTEVHTQSDIDRLVTSLSEVVK